MAYMENNQQDPLVRAPQLCQMLHLSGLHERSRYCYERVLLTPNYMNLNNRLEKNEKPFLFTSNMYYKL